MKKILVIAALLSFSAVAEETCEVKVCNKLERFTLDLGSLLGDYLGETCFNVVLPKSQAVVGAVLSSESRWYQGSTINPTKRSVTRVKEVYSCEE